MNHNKIINDPVYGFIKIESELIFKIVQHPYFQRLRRIKQLGLTDFVYPGATHTRFQHALGAMHLMTLALNVLRQKDIVISDEEFESTQIAILLHDVGHGPLSHTLESKVIPNISHESMGYLIMKELDNQFGGTLKLALSIFRNSYERKFFNQLVCSQLDVDRLDYLKRDSFFTGVSEGNINTERIIQLMNVVGGELVIEEKGIYPIENFLSARRLMYWQVYLHKTAVAAEKLLENILERVFYLKEAHKIDFTGNLKTLFDTDYDNTIQLIQNYCKIDDIDIWENIKYWSNCEDKILCTLSGELLFRKLPKIKLSNNPIEKELIKELRRKISEKYIITKSDSRFYYSYGSVSNEAYISDNNQIMLVNKKGQLKELAQAADLPNIKAISNLVSKYYICYPGDLVL